MLWFLLIRRHARDSQVPWPCLDTAVTARPRVNVSGMRPCLKTSLKVRSRASALNFTLLCPVPFQCYALIVRVLDRIESFALIIDV